MFGRFALESSGTSGALAYLPEKLLAPTPRKTNRPLAERVISRATDHKSGFGRVKLIGRAITAGIPRWQPATVPEPGGQLP